MDKRPTNNKVVVLVNGNVDSAIGDRARSLFAKVKQPVEFHYRGGNKINAALRFVAVVRLARPALCYVVDTAVSGAVAAVVCKVFFGVRYIVDTGDLGYELAESTGVPGWLGRRVIYITESLLIKFADGIVARGTFHKEILSDAGKKNVVVIRDGIHAERCGQVSTSQLRERLDITGSMCVGMMGSLKWNVRHGVCYGWDLVEAMALVPKDLPIKAIVVGDGDGLDRLKSRADELGVAQRIRFTGRVPISEVFQYTSVMDIALSTQSNNRVGNVRTTGKLPEYMAAGCFILATDVGEAKVLLPTEMRLAYTGVKDDSYPQRLAQRITELFELGGDGRKAISAGLRPLALRELSYDHLSDQLSQFLQSVR